MHELNEYVGIVAQLLGIATWPLLSGGIAQPGTEAVGDAVGAEVVGVKVGPAVDGEAVGEAVGSRVGCHVAAEQSIIVWPA